MAAGRVAVSADVVRVELVFLGTGAQPAHGALAVLQSGWEGRLSRKPIIDRRRDETQRREINDVAGNAVFARREARFISFQPAAAVDDHDHGARLAGSI